MRPGEGPDRATAAPDSGLSMDDQALWGALSGCLARPDRAGLCLSEATVEAVARACPDVPVRPALRRRLDDLGARAALDLEFERTLAARRQSPSLGSYLSFLRLKASLTVDEAARRARLPFQKLADLERNLLRPQEIPARPLADLARRLNGSLEMTERLLVTTIRAPRFVLAGSRASLYRAAPGARRTDSEAASLAARGEAGERRENPEYVEEREAAHRLAAEMRRAWRR